MSDPEGNDVLENVDLSSLDELLRVVEETGAGVPEPQGEDARKNIVKVLISELSILQIIDINKTLRQRYSQNPKLTESPNFSAAGLIQSNALRVKSSIDAFRLLREALGTVYMMSLDCQISFVTTGNPKDAFFGQAVNGPFVYMELYEDVYVYSSGTVANCLSKLPGVLYVSGQHQQHCIAVPLSFLLQEENKKIQAEAENERELSDVQQDARDLFVPKKQD